MAKKHNAFKYIGAYCLVLTLGMSCSGCSLLKKQQQPPDDQLQRLAQQSVQGKPLPPEKVKELAGEVGNNWLYGEGLGDTAITAGTIVAFPPYALYVLGNAALSLGGYEPLRVTDMLEPEDRDAWNSAYDKVASGPGRVSAAVAGEEFRSKEVAKERLEKLLSDSEVARHPVRDKR